MDLETVLNLLVGPFGGLVVCIFMLYGVFMLIKRYIIPLIEKAVETHLQQVEKIISSHDEDRRVWQEGMNQIGGRLEKVENRVSEIRGYVSGREVNG